MKKKIFQKTAILMALVLPLSSFAVTSSEQDCDDISNSAYNGRNAANTRIATTDSTVKKGIETARTCLEQFGDAASRQSIVIGGFDMGGLRNVLGNTACSIIPTTLPSSSGFGNIFSNLFSGNINGAVAGIANNALSAAALGAKPIAGSSVVQAVPSTSPAQTRSIFDKVSCSIAGSNC